MQCNNRSSITRTRRRVAAASTTLVLLSVVTTTTTAFVPQLSPQQHALAPARTPVSLHANIRNGNDESVSSPVSNNNSVSNSMNKMAHMLLAGALTASLALGSPGAALAENELSDKYGGGLDTSLVDQTCLIDQCSLQAKACLQDDPSCRKGLTCTAKCLGDNACITGCMARYGNENLDNLLKCTIEDHECIKVAILPGGADQYGQEPRAPAPTLRNFDHATMQGNWYKVAGYNPNYDCYACQRNSFELSKDSADELQMSVEFSMPHLLPDGSPPPPSGSRETLVRSSAPTDYLTGSQSIGLNDYSTHETMVFDKATDVQQHPLVMHAGTSREVSYARTAHSEGEMFGLKFWENWYILGENDKDSDEEFKFIYYNGKTRQNTYNGAFVYSRSKGLNEESLRKVKQIALEAGMDPKQFCRIQNGCFTDQPNQADPLFVDESAPRGRSSTPYNPDIPFRGILASTKVSELLGVESVAARDFIRAGETYPTSPMLQPTNPSADHQRAWWYEVGDYLENPHRHFDYMKSLRITMDWPEDSK